MYKKNNKNKLFVSSIVFIILFSSIVIVIDLEIIPVLPVANYVIDKVAYIGDSNNDVVKTDRSSFIKPSIENVKIRDFMSIDCRNRIRIGGRDKIRKVVPNDLFRIDGAWYILFLLNFVYIELLSIYLELCDEIPDKLFFSNEVIQKTTTIILIFLKN
jgi:hypothetical protein